MKKVIISITITIIIILITASATFAFFSASTNTNNMQSGTDELEVVYTGGTQIEGSMALSSSKEGGHNTTVNISKTADSVPVQANIYLDIEQISESIATEGLIWEVYRTYNNNTTFYDSGTFLECGEPGETKSTCTNGAKLFVVSNYELTTTNTSFTVYIWLNGNIVGNEVIGATFKGALKAESNKITGDLSS